MQLDNTHTSSTLDLLEPLENLVDDSQRVYRQLLKALSEPGLCLNTDVTHSTCNETVHMSTWAIAQTLLDHDCLVYVSDTLSHPEFLNSLTFYTDCRMTKNTNDADFAFLTLAELQSLDSFSNGTVEAPHESATLVIQVDAMGMDNQSHTQQYLLSGPGIPSERALSIADLTNRQVQLLQDNHKQYPCGVDILFCSEQQVCGLPRSTEITEYFPIEENA